MVPRILMSADPAMDIRWIPDLAAEIIPNAGHLLIMDQPEIINARILKFLSNDDHQDFSEV